MKRRGFVAGIVGFFALKRTVTAEPPTIPSTALASGPRYMRSRYDPITGTQHVQVSFDRQTWHAVTATASHSFSNWPAVWTFEVR